MERYEIQKLKNNLFKRNLKIGVQPLEGYVIMVER